MLRTIIFWCFSFALVFAVQRTTAETGPAQFSGQIIAAKVVGQVFVVNQADGLQLPLRLNGTVSSGQSVITGPASSVVLVFSNGATVSLAPQTRLSIDKFLQDPFSEPIKIKELSTEPAGTTSNTTLKLSRGELMVNVKKLNKAAGSSFAIQTPVGAAGIRGTTFGIFYRPGVDTASFGLQMVEGVIELTFGGRGRSVMVESGKQLILDGIGFDPTTGTVTSVPDIPEPTPVSMTTLAALQQTVAQALGAAQTVEFAPATTSGTTPPSAVPPPTTATPQSDDASSGGALASPAPVPSAPRTTGGDGTRSG